MYERKLVQIGNSVGVTFPPDVLVYLGFKAGDWLELEVADHDGVQALVITKSDIRARTKEHAGEIRRHRKTLRDKAPGVSKVSKVPKIRAPRPPSITSQRKK